MKPGGRLAHAMCSLLWEENEVQIEGVLAAHLEFRVVPVREVAAQAAGSAHLEHLALTPARRGTEEFFAAVMERKQALS